MQRLIPLAAALMVGFALGSVSEFNPPANKAQAEIRTGAYEFDDGSFLHHRVGVTHPVAFTWVRPDGSGGMLETWLLFRPSQSDGWKFPSIVNQSLSLDIDYDSNPPHASTTAFVAWALGKLPTELNAISSDFEIHEHCVTID